jgi:hypothetical protein
MLWGLPLVICACGSSESATCDELRGPIEDRFIDMTDDSGMAFTYDTWDFKAGALGVADLDGDGLPDVIAARREGLAAVYRNRGGFRFEEVLDSGIDTATGANAVAITDLDNDGDGDVVLAASGSARVYENLGGFRFRLAQTLPDSGSTEQVLPVDLDGDGRLDLYFSNYDVGRALASLNRIYMNRGGLQLEPSGSAGAGWTWTTTAYDWDGDGDQDLYVANDTLLPDFGGAPMMSPRQGDLFLRNDGVDAAGVPQFTDLGKQLGLADPRSSMGGNLEDIDEDGRLELFVPNLGAKKLYAGDLATGFVDRAAELGVVGLERHNSSCAAGTSDEECLLLSWGSAFADFDLDGHDELMVVNGLTYRGGPPPVLLYERGSDPVFHEVSPTIGCADARGLVVTDLDGDGDQDVMFSVKKGRIAVYENRGTPEPAKWLRVQLRGEASNRDGIGAVVAVHLSSGRTVRRVVGAGGVINTSAPNEAVFGLGADAVDMLEVRWPSAHTTTMLRPPAGMSLLLTESVP